MLNNSGFCTGHRCFFYVKENKTFPEARSYCNERYDGKLFEPLSTTADYFKVVNGLRRKYDTNLHGWTGIVENKHRNYSLTLMNWQPDLQSFGALVKIGCACALRPKKGCALARAHFRVRKL